MKDSKKSTASTSVKQPKKPNGNGPIDMSPHMKEEMDRAIGAQQMAEMSRFNAKVEGIREALLMYEPLDRGAEGYHARSLFRDVMGPIAGAIQSGNVDIDSNVARACANALNHYADKWEEAMDVG